MKDNVKSVIVTGAFGLLGSELLRLLSDLDWHVIAIDIKNRPIELQKNVSFIQWDLSVIDSYQDLGAEIDRLTKNLKGLINNAAFNPKIEEVEQVSFGKFEDIDLERWEQDIQINLTSPIFLVKEFLHLFNHDGEDRCKIINIGSIVGLVSPNQNIYKPISEKMGIEIFKPISYSVTKAGLLMATKYLSTYLSRRGFNVNAIAPGGIENGQDVAFVSEYCKHIPMGRMAKVEEVANVILFLLGKESDYINGETIVVDGGYSIW